jgi:homoserine O-acetyltransferase
MSGEFGSTEACSAEACGEAGRHPPMQPGWIKTAHRHCTLGRFPLESGDSIEEMEVSYVVHGELEREDWPRVLALCAVGSTHHRLDFLIGPGRAFDPAHCTILVVDAIGNGLTTSPSTSRTQPGMAFPRFTIRDMVASQAALLDALGIGEIDTVIGASMGGMQALQWAVSHPTRMKQVVALTPMARTTPWAIAVNETSRRALFGDPALVERGGGDVVPGAGSSEAAPHAWAAWVPLMQLLAARTPAQVDAEFAGDPKAVIDWIARRSGDWLGQQFNPVDWLYQSWAYDAHDVGTTPGFRGDTRAALASIRARTLIAAPPLDLYNPAAAAREAAEGIPGAVFVPIESDWGHQSASAADAASAGMLNRVIGEWLGFGAR